MFLTSSLLLIYVSETIPARSLLTHPLSQKRKTNKLDKKIVAKKLDRRNREPKINRLNYRKIKANRP